MSQYPKKNPLSMQLDLSKFSLATDDEKKMADRMRESTSFFKDGMRRLRKNVVSMICLVIIVLLILIAFIVPLFYPYDYSTSSASVESVSANFLAPMTYSIKERILKSKTGVFIGWSYPRATLEGYKGLPVIDSEEALEEYKEYLVTEPVLITNSNVELYAVWSVDEDGDGVGDYGADLFDFSGTKTKEAETYHITYDLDGGDGEVPVDENGYVPEDEITLSKVNKVTKPGAVFVAWSLEKGLPVLTADNYKEYESKLVTKGTKITEDTTFYAVYAQDENGDSVIDGFKIQTSYGSPKLNRYKLTYNKNMGEGATPIDTNVYAPGSTAIPVSEVEFTKPVKSIFPHILGTDEIGRDYAIRVIVGMRISLLVGIIAAAIVVVIGVLYGAISGYFGGKVDMAMMRVVDIIYAMPDTLIIILLSVSLKDVIMNTSFSKVADKLGGVGLVSILIVFALLYWVGMARLVRGQVLSLREQEFVLAAKSMGVSPLKIITKHMLPNCISVIFISAALQIPSAIFTESFLSFLGIGVSIPMPSLGSLASDYRGQMTIPGREYLFIIPALVIFLIVLSLNLLGQGLRDSFDPKLREVSK